MAGSSEKKRSPIEQMDDEFKRCAALMTRVNIVKMEEPNRQYSLDLSAIIFGPDADGMLTGKTQMLDQPSITSFLREVEDTLKKVERKAQKEIEEQGIQVLFYKMLAGGDIGAEDPEKLKKVSEMIEKKMAELYPKRELIRSMAPVVEDLPEKPDSAGN